MKIISFAAAKDYFKPAFEINADELTLSELKEKLIELNPASAALIKACRFAIDQEFVPDDRRINKNESIYLIPPSSGG